MVFRCSGFAIKHITLLLSLSLGRCYWLSVCVSLAVLLWSLVCFFLLFSAFCVGQCVPFNWHCTTQRANYECNQQIITVLCLLSLFTIIGHNLTLLSLSCIHFARSLSVQNVTLGRGCLQCAVHVYVHIVSVCSFLLVC